MICNMGVPNTLGTHGDSFNYGVLCIGLSRDLIVRLVTIMATIRLYESLFASTTMTTATEYKSNLHESLLSDAEIEEAISYGSDLEAFLSANLSTKETTDFQAELTDIIEVATPTVSGATIYETRTTAAIDDTAATTKDTLSADVESNDTLAAEPIIHS